MAQRFALVLVAFFLQTESHVRSLDPFLRLALDDAVERSPTVRQQIARLQEAEVLVYLRSGSCADPDLFACTMIAPGAGSQRVLQISFVLRNNRGVTILQQRRERLLAQIGHELQHAIEVAESPEVVDNASLLRLYGRIGYRSASWREVFETAAAVNAGTAVLSELRQR